MKPTEIHEVQELIKAGKTYRQICIKTGLSFARVSQIGSSMRLVENVIQENKQLREKNKPLKSQLSVFTQMEEENERLKKEVEYWKAENLDTLGLAWRHADNAATAGTVAFKEALEYAKGRGI